MLSLLAETVELHMIADVPVGVLLSGGVDSTGVLSFAVQRTEKRSAVSRLVFPAGKLPTRDHMPDWRQRGSEPSIMT